MGIASTEAEFYEVAELFRSIRGFKDSYPLAAKCRVKAKTIRKESIYSEAIEKMNEASTEAIYKEVADMFSHCAGYKDADALREKCIENAAICRKDDVLAKAKADMQRDTLEGYRSAKNNLINISGWKAADELLALCQKKIKEFQQRDYKDKGLCQYCGGTFKGVFTKKCSLCGKPKDY